MGNQPVELEIFWTSPSLTRKLSFVLIIIMQGVERDGDDLPMSIATRRWPQHVCYMKLLMASVGVRGKSRREVSKKMAGFG